VINLLVLSRKKEESIMIGDNIEIKIVKIEGKTVKIGIVAPRNVRILRKELYDEIRRENIQATRSVTTISFKEIAGGVYFENKSGSKINEPS